MRKFLTKNFWNIEVWAVQKHVNLVDLVKSFPTNIYLQNLASIQKRTSPVKFAHLAEKSGKGSISNLSLIFQPNEQTLQGSFSSVSTPNFASKYSLESSWRDLQDLHAFAPLRPQYFRNFSSKIFAFFGKKKKKFVMFEFFSLIFAQILMKFCRNFADNLENVEIFWNFWIF